MEMEMVSLVITPASVMLCFDGLEVWLPEGREILPKDKSNIQLEAKTSQRLL